MGYDNLCKGCFADKGNSGKCPFCGFEEAKYVLPPHGLAPGMVLGNRYIVGRVLGSGGFGITYIAYDTKLEFTVAIKEYLPKQLSLRSTDNISVSPHSESDAKEFRHHMKSFMKEAKTLAKFNNEPGIVSVQDVFEDNGTAYIVMGYVNGITLEEYLVRNGNRLPGEKVVQVMSAVMESLRKVHREGLIHRDISPDNICITPDNEVKLLDFGAARYFISDEKTTVSVVLKRGYAPLEQYYNKKENQGPWTDIYSIAATMYRAITGVKPTEALERVGTDGLKSPGDLGIKVPDHIESAIMKGLNLQYADRPKTLDEFIRLLKPVETTEIGGIDPAFARELKKGGRKLRIPVLTGLAVVVAAVSLLLVLGNRDGTKDPLHGTVAAGKENGALSAGQGDLIAVNPLGEPLPPGNSTAVDSGESSGNPDQEPTAPPSETPTLQPTALPDETGTPETTAPPADTATPEPTAPLAGTATPEPTAPPAGTATPKPTAPPAGAATPKPTATPAGTATPEPTPPLSAALEIPDMRNRSKSEVVAFLEENGIEYTIQSDYNDTVPTGFVISLSIPALKSGVVVITISLGKSPEKLFEELEVTEGIHIVTDPETSMHKISMNMDNLPSGLPELMDVGIVCTNAASDADILAMADYHVREQHKASFRFNGRTGEYYRFSDDHSRYIILLLFDTDMNFVGYFTYRNPSVKDLEGSAAIDLTSLPPQPDGPFYNHSAVVGDAAATHVRSNIDDIYVVSVTPTEDLTDGDEVIMTVAFEYNLISQDSANINICVNNGNEPQANIENTRLLVSKGRAAVTLSFPTGVKYWNDGTGVIVNAYVSKSDNSTLAGSNWYRIPISQRE